MSIFKRFGGILAVFGITIGFGFLGFALAYPGLLFIALLCCWPLLWAVTAWTVRGLRDNYQLVPKVPTAPNGPRQRRERPPVPQEEF